MKSFTLNEQQMSEMYASGNWFMFPRCFLLVMSEAEAVLLAYLINFSTLKKSWENHEGWFYCTRATILDNLCITMRRQTNLFVSLEKRGFLQSQWRKTVGKNNRVVTLKWMKVNIGAVYEKARKKDIAMRKDERSSMKVNKAYVDNTLRRGSLKKSENPNDKRKKQSE